MAVSGSVDHGRTTQEDLEDEVTLSQDPREIAEFNHARAILKRRHKCQCFHCVQEFLDKTKLKVRKEKK